MTALEKFQKLCLQIYRTAAIQYSAMVTHMDIAVAARKRALGEQRKHKRLSERYNEQSEIINRWTGILSTLSTFKAFMTSEDAMEGGGVFPIGEEILSTLGVTPDQTFEEILQMDIVRPLTFTRIPPAKIVALEAEYKPELKKLSKPTKPWALQMHRMLKEMTFDVYKGVSSARWFYKQAEKIRPELVAMKDEKVDYALALWDMVHSESKGYMHASRECLSRTDAALRWSLGEKIDKKQDMVRKANFMRFDENVMTCAGGLYLINYDKLPVEWKDRVEDYPSGA